MDKLHGNVEVLDRRGRHLGNSGPNGGIVDGSQDKSDRHDINI